MVLCLNNPHLGTETMEQTILDQDPDNLEALLFYITQIYSQTLRCVWRRGLAEQLLCMCLNYTPLGMV
jgi:hypothetical protein